MLLEIESNTALQERLDAELSVAEDLAGQVTLDEDLAPETRPTVPGDLFATRKSDTSSQRPTFMVELMEAWAQP